MIKKTFIAFLGLTFFLSKAQDQRKSLYDDQAVLKKWREELTTEIKGRNSGWIFKGLNSLQFNQNAFKNWVQGGVNTISFVGRLDYEAHFTKGLNIWDSRLILGYGIQSEKGKPYLKNEDIINLQSSYGHKFSQSWYYGGRLDFRTQFSKGMDNKNPNSKISNFFAPAYLALGLGLDYKPDENFSLFIHPLTSRMTFITDQEVFGNETKAYGIEKGKSFLFQLGGSLGARYRCEVMKNVIFDNNLNLFSDYLKGPSIVANYGGILMFKINKFLSSQLNLDLAYDKNQTDKIQLKQTLGIGLTYLLGQNT